MNKLIIIIAMLLVSVQAWCGDNAYNLKMNSIKLDFLACASEYDLSKLRDSIDHAFSIAENQSNSKKLDDCEAKLNEYIRRAANGDDAVNDGLINVISYMATDESISKRIFAHKYERKLQMAKQSAMKNVTSAPGDKGRDKKKTDHE